MGAKGIRLASGSRRKLLRWLGTLLVAIGLLLLSVVGIYYAYATMSQAQLDQMVKGEPTAPSMADYEGAVPVEPSPPLPKEEPPVFRPTKPVQIPQTAPPFPSAARIVIPAIDVDSKVVELGTKYEKGELVWETADHAVGHHLGTANPGEVGNMVMSGHISSPLKGEGSVFKRLPEVKPGDSILVFTAEATHFYRVTETKVVLPSEVKVMEPTAEPILTLITCVPDWVYSHRLVVIAKPFKAPEPLGAPVD